MRFLKADTSSDVIVGPFLDKWDGVTPETSFTVTAVDFDMYKGSTLQTRSLVASGAAGDERNFVHVAKGMWKISLTTSDTDTEGILRLYFEYSGVFLPVWEDVMVLSVQVYDSLFGIDKLQVDAVQIEGWTLNNKVGNNFNAFFQNAGVDTSKKVDNVATQTEVQQACQSALEDDNLHQAAKMLLNKAVQNKITGAVSYYDDDGETIILTHTPTDSESEITRTPS